ncbi:MAG: hypothetical protein AAFS07_09405 [Pseudomonadota bacterium]
MKLSGAGIATAALCALLLAAPASADTPPRSERGAANCKALLEDTYGATNVEITRINRRDLRHILVHVDATMANDAREQLRCLLTPHGDEIKRVQMYIAGYGKNDGWAGASHIPTKPAVAPAEVETAVEPALPAATPQFSSADEAHPTDKFKPVPTQ